jgi:dTDP-4-amino-4,6-dideoxygalactose transaminase
MSFVPFNDLQDLHLPKRDEFHKILDHHLDNSAFIGGESVAQFEHDFAEFCETPGCVGTSSGTDALYVALKCMEVGVGDAVLTAPNSFIATAEAISMCGATPVFVDIQSDDLNLDPIALERVLSSHPLKEHFKVLLPVHLHGRPAQMEALSVLAQGAGLEMLADGAQAHGARVGQRSVNELARATTYSFYPGKNLGALGDAGAIVSHDNELLSKMKAFSNHGREDKYLHREVGCNARLDALQASFLKFKLRSLGEQTQMRQKIASKYREAFEDLPFLLLPKDPPDGGVVYHLFIVLCDERDALQNHLRGLGVQTGVHYPVPLHLQKAYAHLGYQEGDFPVAEAQAQRTLSLPLFPHMSEEQIEQVISSVRSFNPGR